MALKGVCLFDLTAIRQAYIFDSEIILGVVGIGRDLSPAA